MLTLTEDEKKELIPTLRKLSRRKYLEPREEQQLDLYKRILDEEDRIFAGEELTEAEQQIKEVNRRLYELANKRRQKQEKGDFFKMPDAYEDDKGRLDRDKKMSVLTRRLEEEKIEMTEHEMWEAGQTGKSRAAFGAADKQEAERRKQEKNY